MTDRTKIIETAKIIECAARAAHEANRAWCCLHGDYSQSSWNDAPDWQRGSAIEGVQGVLAGNGPEEQHEAWSASKVRDGWVYGLIKDGDAKTHPCLIPYGDLPPEQQAKDTVYVGVVRAVLTAGGLIPTP